MLFFKICSSLILAKNEQEQAQKHHLSFHVFFMTLGTGCIILTKRISRRSQKMSKISKVRHSWGLHRSILRENCIFEIDKSENNYYICRFVGFYVNSTPRTTPPPDCTCCLFGKFAIWNFYDRTVPFGKRIGIPLLIFIKKLGVPPNHQTFGRTSRVVPLRVHGIFSRNTIFVDA